jgi:outer membrane protein assembly factor BamD
MRTVAISTLFAVWAVIFTGCGQKAVQEYNQPASYWYDKMIHAIGTGSLERADGYYSSLQSEHIGSPLLGEATIILAMAHIEAGEYLLGEHFLNDYIKRYANMKQREFAEYLKVKAKYLALPNPRRDQGLIENVIREGELFKQRYLRSIYFDTVDTMVTRLYLAQTALNESIASLYDRLDKPKAAAYYRAIKPQPWIDREEVEPADVPWYKVMFEGDGTESWYGFLIPDTQSVVSRNSEGLEKE